MEERYLKFEDLMADLTAYLVSEYEMEPRDAVGLVMNSPLTQQLYSSEEPITEQRVKVPAYWIVSITKYRLKLKEYPNVRWDEIMRIA